MGLSKDSKYKIGAHLLALKGINLKILDQIVVFDFFFDGRIDEDDELVFDGDILTWADIVTIL